MRKTPHLHSRRDQLKDWQPQKIVNPHHGALTAPAVDHHAGFEH